MARPLRIEFDGAFHHVMSRGNDGMALFRDDPDRRKFLELLERAIKRSYWILHDWVLMTNHFHLAIETPECTLSSGTTEGKGRRASASPLTKSQALAERLAAACY